MPAKYHIHTEPAAPRFRPVGKLGIVEWREDCSNCHNCVKHQCVYGFYGDEIDALRKQNGYLDYIYQCKGCLACIQNCTKNILTRVINPEYNRLGDDYYTPEIIVSTWYQAETGRIPVSGGGYGGPFTGLGFDAMWTDMSEIVRPTRDGIHGREYINTSVDIGRKVNHLIFDNDQISGSPPPMIETPLPVVFDLIPERWHRGPVVGSIIKAAAELGLFTIVRGQDHTKDSPTEQPDTILLLDQTDQITDKALGAAAMVMLPDRKDVMTVQGAIKDKNAEQIVAIRIPARPGVSKRIVELVQQGAEVINLVFDSHGLEDAPSKPRHMREVLRDVHGALTKNSTRDQVTIIACGGIALPEHMAKAIICGADLVALDVPLVVAMECRLCGECRRDKPCPVDLDQIDPQFAVRRVINLIGAWHQQLIEMLGAMGIREVRRLRGETGRCMFFQDLEEETFGRLFGKPKVQHETEVK